MSTETKLNPEAELIVKYKAHLKSNQLKDELYKWELLTKFKGRPNLNESDFLAELKSIKYGNLIYHNGIAVMQHLATENPEPYRDCFKVLFDETQPLLDRIKNFSEEVTKLYRVLDPNEKHSDHHDERTIATLLTFYNPDKYVFFKDSFYQKYCKLINVPSQKRGNKYVHYLALVDDFINNYISNDAELLNLVSAFVPENLYQDTNHKLLAQDILYQCLDLGANKEAMEDNNSVSPTLTQSLISDTMTPPLNQILYGPPGTGKTYNTINKAISIIENVKEETLGYEERSALKMRFEKYFSSGQIVFTTFHQSMSYEDFIEGIKPDINENNNVVYDVKDGIFKSLCNNAKVVKIATNSIDWDKSQYYKMSLGGKHRSDIHDWCIENNVISLGWGGSEDLSKIASIKNWAEYRAAFNAEYPDLVKDTRFNIQATYAFINMKADDIVVISKGNQIIDAIGIIKGDYYWDDNSPFDFYHFRKVEWVVKNLNSSPEKYFNMQISQMSIYEIGKQDVKIEAFKELTTKVESNTPKPYVLIIDEINRGNVSQIFGELITLIEESKRLGKEEALEVTLPYSNEKFSVPSNLYIIGTMNTADRSVEALDTALRRRFCFEEMLPEPKLIATKGKLKDSNGVIDGIDLVLVLQTINKRIELLSNRDHQIGHSYFLNVASIKDLQETFKRNIIPLLQEYFYNDYEKIALVLGEGFVEIQDNNISNIGFAKLSIEVERPELSTKYVLKKDINIQEAIQKLLNA